jgi:tryptophan-rich sensory protein
MTILSDLRVPDVFSERMLWFYVLLAIAVFVVIFIIVRENHSNVHAWARFPVWLSNPFLMGVVFFVVLVLAAYSTHGGHRASSPVGRNLIGTFFLVVAVILVVLAYLVYRAHNFMAAYWLSVVGLVVALVHMYSVWRVDAFAGYAAVPLVVMFALLAYTLWFASDECADISECAPVYSS